jgi:hypothetical protein
MRNCAFCGWSIERPAVRVEFTCFTERNSTDPAPAEALPAHHDCGARAYSALLDWKLDPLRFPVQVTSLEPPAGHHSRTCEVCGDAQAEPRSGLLVQLFVERRAELILAAEFALQGHPACVESLSRRTREARLVAVAESIPG